MNAIAPSRDGSSIAARWRDIVFTWIAMRLGSISRSVASICVAVRSASPFVRATSIAVDANSCASDVKMKGRGSSPSVRTLVVRRDADDLIRDGVGAEGLADGVLAGPELVGHRFD